MTEVVTLKASKHMRIGEYIKERICKKKTDDGIRVCRILGMDKVNNKRNLGS